MAIGTRRSIAIQHCRQILSGVRVRKLRDGLGSTGAHDVAAAFAALGAEVDHPVGSLDDFQIVLDDED